jgi:hypothetical protein
VPELEVPERPPLMLENINDGSPWEVPELEIRERPPSMLENVDDEPLGRCRNWRSGSIHHQHCKTWTADPLGGARAPTINAMKHGRRPPWEVPELEVPVRPPSTL